MKMITGLLETTSGKILFDGEPIEKDLIAYKQRMGYVPEEPYLYCAFERPGIPHHGRVNCAIFPQSRQRIESTDCCACFRCTAIGMRRSRRTPRACDRRCCFPLRCCTIRICYLLDEPFSGLDIGTGLVLRSLIQELAARGKVVLFSSHELETVERVCSHVMILHRGKIVADDSIERLRTLMAVPTLEGIFEQLAIEQDTAAISREIADLIQGMTHE